MRATKRQLVGRKIVDVEWRPSPDGRGGTARQPMLTLDDGSQIAFLVVETDVGDYGVDIHRTPKGGS